MSDSRGVTPAAEGLESTVWNVVGQVYVPKVHTENVMMWHATVPADTFVPPHIHPTQDEWIYMLDGSATGCRKAKSQPSSACRTSVA